MSKLEEHLKNVNYKIILMKRDFLWVEPRNDMPEDRVIDEIEEIKKR